MNTFTRIFAFGLFALALATPVQAGKAINFVFADLSGKTLLLSDFKGKWVLVNFWAPWCPRCWAEVPLLRELDRRADFAVIGIGMDYGLDPAAVRSLASRHRFDVTAIVAGGSRKDPESASRQVGPVDFYPTSYLYDPTGELVMFIPGPVRKDKILAYMKAWTQPAGGT